MIDERHDARAGREKRKPRATPLCFRLSCMMRWARWIARARAPPAGLCKCAACEDAQPVAQSRGEGCAAARDDEVSGVLRGRIDETGAWRCRGDFEGLGDMQVGCVVSSLNLLLLMMYRGGFDLWVHF